MTDETDSSPRAGLAVSIAGDRCVFLTTGAETKGAFAAFELYSMPHGGPPPHIHRRECEFFLVLDGEFEFYVGGETLKRKTGESILAPADIPHHYANVGAAPGRLLCTTAPAGMDRFFWLAGTRLESADAEPIPPTQADIQRIIDLAPSFGLEILGPEPG